MGILEIITATIVRTVPAEIIDRGRAKREEGIKKYGTIGFEILDPSLYLQRRERHVTFVLIEY